MTMETLLSEALQMPLQERAIIAERLISSLDTAIDPDVETAWQQEVQNRLDRMEKGELTFLPWEEVRRQLRNRSGATD